MDAVRSAHLALTCGDRLIWLSDGEVDPIVDSVT